MFNIGDFMKLKSINPATEELNKEFEIFSEDKIVKIVEESRKAFNEWKNYDLSNRTKYLLNLADVLRKRKNEYGRLISIEMGKPIKQAIAEVEKCAWTAEIYSEKADEWLQEEEVQVDGKKHIVTFEPLGIILSIMPWNFPFWQALRFAIPTLVAGNVSILRHSSNVPMCALAIEESFKEAGFPKSVFRTIFTDHKMITKLIENDYINGVSLTGSLGAGSKIGGLAGKNIKKFVLELGGSDPFIVLEDSDINLASKNAIQGRMMNTGQSCIAAKRFIVIENIAEQFIGKLVELNKKLIIGNPLDENTDIGPLANEQQLREIELQVQDAVEKGGNILDGGKRVGEKGFFFQPTLISNVNSKMMLLKDEVFGPVAPIIIVKDNIEAVKMANSTNLGLGASVWSKDENKAMEIARKLDAGSIFINGIVKSDPRMPFGGIKKSGIGRELSHYGLKEFVNVKAINVYSQT